MVKSLIFKALQRLSVKRSRETKPREAVIASLQGMIRPAFGTTPPFPQTAPDSGHEIARSLTRLRMPGSRKPSSSPPADVN